MRPTALTSSSHARWLTVLALSALLGGCGDGHLRADSGADASADAGDHDTGRGCPAHTHEVSPGVCDATLAFEESTPIPLARDHHSTALFETAAGPRLMVFGGAVILPGQHTQSTSDDVAIAPLNADGSVGEWTQGPMLPGPRAGHAMGVVGDTVILAGGRNATQLLRTTTLARVQPDGTLGAWTAGPNLPAARFHPSGTAHGRWVYVSGGLAAVSGATVAQPEVWGARLGDDGTLGAWQTLTPLPEAISHHTTFVHEGFLFVAGGLGGDPSVVTEERLQVYRARIAADGTLGAWETVNELPLWIATHSSAIHAGHVYLFGGVEGNRGNTDGVMRAALLPGGGLGAWEDSTPLPGARAHLHHAPVREGRVYLVAGSELPHTPVETTLVGRFE